jgi:hypothetical protein
MTYRIEFKHGNAPWKPTYQSFSTESAARKSMKAARAEIKDEQDPDGPATKWRVREGRGATSGLSVGWAQWGLIGLLGYLLVTK